jgi:hypothetical protein
MNGPIATSQAAGSAQQAASVAFGRPSAGPPEKVSPVSEGDRSRSSVRDEAGPPEKTQSNPAAPGRKDGAGGSAKTQAPPYFVEFRPVEAEGAGRCRQTGSSEDALTSPLESRSDEERETLPLPGDSSAPAPREALAEALAAAKARWIEVNQEVLEANTLPGQSPPDSPQDAAPVKGGDIMETRRTSSPTEQASSPKVPDSAPPSGKGSPDVEVGDGPRGRLAILYENLATSLSNPHPTKPLIDVFV